MAQNKTIKLNVHIIDSIKVNSPQHKAFKVFHQSSFPLFPSIIATRQNEKDKQLIQILSIQNLSRNVSLKQKSDSQNLEILYNLLKFICYLHQKQFCTGDKDLQQFLFYDKNTGKIKIKPYKSVPINAEKQQIKKQKSQNWIYSQYQKNSQLRDIWKWAILVSKIMFTFQIEKYIQKIYNCDKEKVSQFIPQISVKNSFQYSAELLSLITQCIKPSPKKRPKIQDIIPIFQKIMKNIDTPLSQKLLQQSQKLFQENQKQHKSQFEIQIKQDLILTDDLKKKIINQFVKNAQKPPKSFKPLYRATRVQFNTRVFYQQCAKKDKLLILIDTVQSGVICCYIQPQLDILDNSGFSGHFVADPSLRSFIYSVKNQELYKLLNKDKAFKCVPGKGPIIGDDDIILGDSSKNNWCYFPKSFNSGKVKKLTPKPQFLIKNYDVYTINF